MRKVITLLLLISWSVSLTYSVELVDGGFLLNREEFEAATEALDLAEWYELEEVPRIIAAADLALTEKVMIIDSLEDKVATLTRHRRTLIWGVILMPLMAYLIGRSG